MSELERAIKMVFDDLQKMPIEVLRAKLAEIDKEMRTPGCCPVICDGQCQGNGWCYLATGFRGETKYTKIVNGLMVYPGEPNYPE